MSEEHPSNSGEPLSRLRKAERLAEDLAAASLARIEKARIAGKDAISQLKSRGKGVAGDISNAAQALWLPENPGVVLGDSPTFMIPPTELQSEPAFLSMTWRSDALLGLSALGVVTLEDEIITVTRSLFSR